MWQSPEMFSNAIHLLKMVEDQKSVAERALKDGNFDRALIAYTEAIEIASSNPNVHGELFKLYSNRSLVHFKMKNFSEAVLDADQCIVCNDVWTKGHWRRANAMKSLKEDYEALISLINGFIRSMEQKSDRDIFDFTTAMIPIICRLKADPLNILNNIEEVELHHDLIAKVIRHFGKHSQWEEISLMVLGIHGGLSNGFDGIAWDITAYDMAIKDVCIKSLVKSLYDNQEREWRFKLASKLSKNAKIHEDLQAFINEIQLELSEPAFRTGIKTALDTGNIYLLKFFFENYVGITDEKDARDEHGNTGLHLLVQSDKRSTTLGETIINLLINHGCSVNIMNNSDRRPIDYLNPTDTGYIVLSNAEAAIPVEEMRKNIIELKKAGEECLGKQDYKSALQKYTAAINLCTNNLDLYNELPALLTNRSKVYTDDKQYVLALKDTEDSIKVDSKWVKAYWRKGVILRCQKKYKESFYTFVTGYKQTLANKEENKNFLSEALAVLLELNVEEVQITLTGLANSKWKELIAKICKGNDRHSLRVFALGTEVFLKEKETNYDEDDTTTMSDSIVFSSVFPFLRQYKNDDIIKEWTIKLIETLISKNGGLLHIKSFKDDSSDTSLHAVVKFSLIIENVVILNHLPNLETEHSEIVDLNGDSILHIITKHPPPKNTMVLVMVAKILLEKGFSTSVKDNDGKIPIEYLKRSDDELFKLLSVGKGEFGKAIKIREMPSSEESENPIKLQKQGNTFFEQEQYEAAIDQYTKAIKLTKDETSLSRLHGNRSECWLKLKKNDKAMEDSNLCISYDRIWFKGHYRLGKVLRAMGKHVDAKKAFTDSFNLVKAGSQQKIEILSEIMVECSDLVSHQSKEFENHMLLNTFASKELIVRTAYFLVREKKFKAAEMIFYQCTDWYTKIEVKKDLQPLCNLQNIKKHTQIINLIHLLLEAGSDYLSLKVCYGDRYIHAVVRMTLKSEICLLLDYVLQTYVTPNKEIDILDENDNTALHIAAADSKCSSKIRYVVIKCLLENNANTCIRNKVGKLAVDLIPRRDQRCVFEINKAMECRKEAMEQNRKKKKQKQQKDCGRKKENKTAPQSMGEEREKVKTFDDKMCCDCKRRIKESRECFNKSYSKSGYKALATVLMHDDNNVDHTELHAEAVQTVVQQLVTKARPVEVTGLTQIPCKFYQEIIDGLTKSKKYEQIQILVIEYRKKHGSDKLRGFAQNINIVDVIRNMKGKYQSRLQSTISNFLDSGAVLEADGKKSIEEAIKRHDVSILVALLDKGANPVHLSLRQGDTPLHAALLLELTSNEGNFTVFRKLIEMYKSNSTEYPILNPNQRDNNGDGLFHLVTKSKFNKTVQKAAQMLVEQNISASFLNKNGKSPEDYLADKESDPRLTYLRQASGSAVRPMQKCSESEQENVKSNKRQDSSTEGILKTSKNSGHITDISKTRKRVGDIISKLPSKPYYSWKTRKGHGKESGTEIAELKTQSLPTRQDHMQTGKVSDAPPADEKPLGQPIQREEKTETEESESQSKDLSTVASISDQGSKQMAILTDEEEVETFLEEPFDNLPWEVEFTANVLKTLKDKDLQAREKRKIIRIIKQLASGDWQTSMCRLLQNTQKLKLYEANLSKGSRIIWERAVSFSPRLSGKERDRMCEGNTENDVSIYSDVIRVWDIVLDHDNLKRSVEKVIKSHCRGEECRIQKKLVATNLNECQSDKKCPNIYVEGMDETEGTHSKESLHYYPLISDNETEHNILKFYSFSENLVHHVLENAEAEVDFPFRETDLEYTIIHLPSDVPILLLGRSGTGKTTCCLYRLYTKFMMYWSGYNKTETGEPLLPRCEACVQKEDKNQATGYSLNEKEDFEDEDNDEEKYDHLHQIFITKNNVLCHEVQKNFRELRRASCVTKEHLLMESVPLPLRLQDVGEYQYPLFITSKNILLMLDASLGEPYFFERNAEGAISIDIKGWTKESLRPSLASLQVRDSDDEDGENENCSNIYDLKKESTGKRHSGTQVNLNPKREVTYEVFSNEVWPKIKNKIKNKYHPSLIWTEIMSFIKGSFEALSKTSGYLTKEEYLEVGKKRAPNFSGEREIVYDLFKLYDRFIKRNILFDETDLVHNVYNRLGQKQRVLWVIHEIYVDETQDFTQAELCLLLRLCKNPNHMFLTKDTAQSIMRGISFRFSDLKILFYQASLAVGNTPTINPPKKVHQLTYNYRSHEGILALATSVIDLMMHFFPESFDRLQKDQGFLDGPKPVLLESCTFTDLAVLLSGNERETSHIEFGAHQAILVVDEKARKNIPKELHKALILTIYESKGLEFDDILLFNFFKDSEAEEDWRLVRHYPRFADESHDHSTNTKSLLEIDPDQKEHNPPVKQFDQNRHKLLNSELKHLYTAVTRARVNVWIFDEDKAKRTPMFKYFQSRKVATVHSQATGGIMFAKKSQKNDWIQRGQDFMNRHLYEPANICFINGGDEHKAKVALAYCTFRQAQSDGDKHKFLQAAEMFIDCEFLADAEQSLVHAQEYKLLAWLYEKDGKLEKAAKTYIESKCPEESSKCYINLGMFSHAIDTLCDFELFEKAIVVLEKYEKETKENAIPIPEEYAPKSKHTHERLRHKVAYQYHIAKNKELMMKNLDELPRETDKIDFLKAHGYVEDAACLLKQQGKFSDAANLYLLKGNTKEACKLARKKKNKNILARCYVMQAQIYLSDVSEKTIDEKVQKELYIKLENAIKHSKKSKQSDLLGEAHLLIGEMMDDIEAIQASWGAFNRSKPLKNEAGQLECMKWMVNNSPLHQNENIKKVVLGMQNLFEILNLVRLDDVHAERRLERVYNFYGFETVPYNPTVLRLYPFQRSRAMEFMSSYLQKKEETKFEVTVPIKSVQEELSKHLFKRGNQWLSKICLVVHDLRQPVVQCSKYLSGEDSKPEHRKSCRYMHQPHTRETLCKLLQMDAFLVELDGFFKEGMKKIVHKKPKSISFDNPLANLNCRVQLLSDLMPEHYQPWQVMNDIKACMILRSQVVKDSISSFVMKYLLEIYEDLITKDRRNQSIKVFIKLTFLSRYFDIWTNVKPNRIITELEHNLLREFTQKESVKNQTKLRALGFIVQKQTDENKDAKPIVQCIARRFLEGFICLMGKSNAMESLVKFTQFVDLLVQQNKPDILPEMHELLFWFEFYFTVCLCFAAKFNDDLNEFFLPTSYISTVHFVDSAFVEGNQPSTFELIQEHRSSKKNETSIFVQSRFKKLLTMVRKGKSNINLILLVFKSERDRSVDFLIAERVLVFCLTCLCNLGKLRFPDIESEIMGILTSIELHKDSPSRLQEAMESVKTAECRADLAVVLKKLLLERNHENINYCTWQEGRNGFRYEPLKEDLKLKLAFVEWNIVNRMSIPSESTIQQEVETQDTSISAEDRIVWENEQKELRKQQKKHNAANTIRSWIKNVLFIKKCKRLAFYFKSYMENEKLKKRLKVFDRIILDDTTCGVCDVHFDQAPEENLQLHDESVHEGHISSVSVKQNQGKQTYASVLRNEPENLSDNSHTVMSSQSSQKAKHIESAEHKAKYKEYCILRESYRNVIALRLEKVYDFVSKYQLNSENTAQNIPNNDLEIQRLVGQPGNIENKLEEIIARRSWGLHKELLLMSDEMEKIFSTVSTQILPGET